MWGGQSGHDAAAIAGTYYLRANNAGGGAPPVPLEELPYEMSRSALRMKALL